MASNNDTRPQLPCDWSARCAAVASELQSGTPMSLGRIADDLGIPFDLFALMIALQASRAGIPVFMSAGELPTKLPKNLN